ncbi:leucine-rich repeat receptor protein kinase HPCA1-like isoform X1 [Silene latifolia]|uniref:leucine-rich repeat receptor protein kinase HPCA1-like isoform X1 n=1 Tax=Silene latifolia TaxID=37657 RepID=UPI003D76E104
MGLQVAIWLILICIPSTIILSETNSQDVTVLLTLKQMWKNVPPSWNRGNDSCGGQWEGIACRDSRIISITLSSMGLIGILPGDIQGLSELETLDLSYNKGLSGNLPPAIGNLAKLTTLILAGCNFNGELPDTIGSLSKLVFLSLNSNGFSGTIPQTIGKLSELYWLDLAANKLTGNIPISPGLDMLVHAKLFHFGGNQLSGAIPPQLFNENMNLIHLLLDNNQFSGTIPTTLSLVRTLEVIRFDWNSLIGSVPLSINTLIVLKTLLLSNNKLAGVMPDLTGMNLLSYVDMSNNSFEVSDVPSWVTALPSLTTLMMEQSQIQGIIPSSFFGLPQLQKVVLKSNKLSGMLDLGAAHSSQLQFVDLQNNSISDYTRRPADNNLQLILVGNPVCGTVLTEQSQLCFLPQSSQSYTTPRNCETVPCTSGGASSPSCHCSYPYSGTLTFVAPQFSNLQNFTNYGALERAFMNAFFANKMPVGSVSLSNIFRDTSNYLHITLQIFPLGQDRFNRTTILSIGFMLSSQTFKPPSFYGPFTFLPAEYTTFSDGSEPSSEAKSKTSRVRKILAIIGGSIVGVITLISSIFAAKSLIRCYNDRSCNNVCNNCCSWSFGNRKTQKDEDDERQDKWILQFIRQKPRP